ncbi:MAG TPA: acyl-CoA dehydrogenase family protein [Candidatus Polarisedimenticolia bacterium]|nr:acyl-CoA dehydrogenase family protein [Candidatus Polarisedimenticolia bacterium]
MDFSWTDEQIELQRSVDEFACAELSGSVVESDAAGRFDLDGWRKCAAFGILGLPIPAAHGGSGADLLTTILVMETLGRRCKDNGLLFAMNAHMWSAELPLLVFGTEAQKDKYLGPMCRGEMISGNGSSEPDSGSDVFAMKTSARRRGDSYVLNGTKMFVTNAPMADVLVIYATLGSQRGIAGLCAFLVEKGFPGYSVGRDISKMGLRTSPMAEVILQDCVVPIENRLGPEGAGMAAFNCSMEWERACILASCIGAMERQLQECVAYSRARRQFGKPIGAFQSVSNRITDMKVRVETGRMLLYKIGALLGQGRRAPLEAAMAKLHISESFVQSCLDAIQIHGGYGYTTEFEHERMLRDAVASRLYSGTSEIQRNIIARHMGL